MRPQRNAPASVNSPPSIPTYRSGVTILAVALAIFLVAIWLTGFLGWWG